jgi:L-alanine-DL-glutamate epimerase-like enolase superfamily enzyme
MQSIFVELHTVSGPVIRGPISLDQAFIIDTQPRRLVEGADALAHEVLWDKMYRASVHGRKGVNMMPMSAIDCAMWDLKGRWGCLPGLKAGAWLADT